MAADRPILRVPTSVDVAALDFAAVVNEHWNGVFRLLNSLGGDAHAAEDLTQETFLRALDRIDRFSPGTNMRAWLLRIATNAFFDEQRKRKRSKLQKLADDLPVRDDPAGDALHVLETAEQAALARAAMAELTELTRLIFHLRVEEDLSFREIAELAGTTEQSARWHMHQARTKLLARLGECDEAGKSKMAPKGGER